MAQEFPELRVSDSKLLFLPCSSKNTGLRASNGDAADFDDDGFVFDIDLSLLVERDKLTIGNMIGEGSHSIVYEGWYENLPVAIKVILPERTMDASPDCKAKFQREVNMLSRVKHKNIVKFIGASVEPSMMIITELLEGGSLQRHLKSIYPKTLDFQQLLCFALHISQAMEYLHANGIVHGDLKPGNLLLTKDKMQVKLADFGIAKEEQFDDMTCEAGTYRYMAPELFSKNPLPKGAKKCYDRKADVYSFAMVLWSLIKNETPFKGRKDVMAAYAAAKAEDPSLRPEFSEITKNLTMLLPNCCSTGTALASITQTEQELDSNIEDYNKTPVSVENFSKHKSQSQHKAKTRKADSAKRKPKKNNSKLKYLCLFKCFAI